MRYIVDSVENGIATLERDDLALVIVPASELPEDVKQHDCLDFEDGVWTIDRERTERRMQSAREKTDALFGRS